MPENYQIHIQKYNNTLRYTQFKRKVNLWHRRFAEGCKKIRKNWWETGINIVTGVKNSLTWGKTKKIA